MAYYRVEAEVRDCFDVYIQAKSKKDAIKKAEDKEYTYFDYAHVEKITKEEYENYK